MTAIAGVVTAAPTRSAGRPTANAILALSLSFAATPPGIFFFLELMNRNGGICYERPWFSASFSWLLIGPALFAFSKIVSPWRLTSPSLFIVRSLHVLVWLLGAGNTFMCAMMV